MTKDNTNRPYCYKKGLVKLVSTLNGNERIHVGIRPYGFHAGNAVTLVSYPKLLCEEYKRQHKKDPNFTFILSINDWEQDALDGPDYRKWPFNIYPKFTSIQHLASEHGMSMTDYWQPIIECAFKCAIRQFPKVSLEVYRNSELKNHKEFKRLLLVTIRNPHEHADLFKVYSDAEVLGSPISYAGAICPECKSAHGKTAIGNKKNIFWKCDDCGVEENGRYEDFDYWWYHKQLLLARLLIYNIDITLSGGDHFSEGDFIIRKEFMNKYTPGVKVPKMLFAPTLFSPKDHDKMSKSRDNTYFVEFEALTKLLGNSDEGEIELSSELAIKYKDEKIKTYCCSL